MEKDLKEYITPPIMLVLFLLAVSLIFIFPVLNMIILGAILAYGIRPLALKIQSKLKVKSISIFISMFLVLVPLILLVAYIAFAISGMLNDFFMSNPNLDINYAISQISMYIPQNPFFDGNNIVPAIGDGAKYVLNYLVSKLGSFANITLDLFILICSVYYFVQDGDVSNDIFFKFDYIGECYGDYNYLLQRCYREAFLQKINSEYMEVTLNVPCLGLMRGSKVNFTSFVNDSRIENKFEVSYFIDYVNFDEDDIKASELFGLESENEITQMTVEEVKSQVEEMNGSCTEGGSK